MAATTDLESEWLIDKFHGFRNARRRHQGNRFGLVDGDENQIFGLSGAPLGIDVRIPEEEDSGQAAGYAHLPEAVRRPR